MERKEKMSFWRRKVTNEKKKGQENIEERRTEENR